MDIDRLLAYDQLGRTHFWLTSKYAILIDLVKNHVDTSNDLASMLDIGCAGGAFLEGFESASKRVGFDRDYRILAGLRDSSIHTVAGDASRLPFQQETFALVSAIDLIEHLEDDLPALEEMYRVLRKGGWLLLCVPAFMALYGKHDTLFGHLRRYKRKQLKERAELAGFVARKTTYIQPLFFFPLWIKRRFFPPSNDALGDFNEISPLNSLFHWMLALEKVPLRYVNFPIGATIIGLFQKE